jgi:HNH endonuclease
MVTVRNDEQQDQLAVAVARCKHGHEFTPANTYFDPKRIGVRYCRTCAAERKAKMRAQRWAIRRERLHPLLRELDGLTVSFLEKVKIDESGCWLWTGHITDFGYGDASHRRAHRALYEVAIGPIPHGFEVDHICRVRHCVKPAHLEAVTGDENRERTIDIPRAVYARRAGRGTVSHCARGHERTSENTYVSPKGDRSCRPCSRMHLRRYRADRRYVAAA